MDFQDQLKNLFPEHQLTDNDAQIEDSSIWLQEEPMICKYEKRKGKPTTIIEGYTGADSDFKQLAKEIKGVIINADSVQVYKDLNVLSARPNSKNMDCVPHYLYGYVNSSIFFSVSNWLFDLKEKLVNKLIFNSRPENKDYFYDYFDNNCSTIINYIKQNKYIIKHLINNT